MSRNRNSQIHDNCAQRTSINSDVHSYRLNLCSVYEQCEITSKNETLVAHVHFIVQLGVVFEQINIRLNTRNCLVRICSIKIGWLWFEYLVQF